MTNDERIIVGIQITNRVQRAGDVQDLLTEYGCNIKTRIGLHDVDANQCSPAGLLLIEFFGARTEADEFAAKLGALEGVHVAMMVFTG